MLTVSLSREASLDRDFVLVVDQLVHESMVVAARDSVSPGAVAVLASFWSAHSIALQGRNRRQDSVDCSGSMAGDSIEAAKRALQAIVRQLGAGDRFVVPFWQHRGAPLARSVENNRDDPTSLPSAGWGH